MTPCEFSEMIRWLKIIDNVCHEKEWKRSIKEQLSSKVYRRSFHYLYNLKSGHKVRKSDLTFVRPGDGIGYEEIEKIIGQKLLNEKKSYDICSIYDV
jgi:sialic acid synthase SpsE